MIIGRTGAQVLQGLLPWISDSFSDEDKVGLCSFSPLSIVIIA